MDAENREFPIPHSIAKYKIEGLLSTGGMSLLYLGTHPDTQEPALIKVLLPKFLKDTDIRERFLNEARLIAKADHPNIVKVYDSGSWEGGLYIAMEFIKGSSLRKILGHQPFSLKRALEILLQIAYAICHLHTHGIVHGDIKPENILITELGQVKLIDFGIAQILTENVLTENGRALAPKRLAGTPIYMSPEQLEDWGKVSYQSDIYALGILAYELALGKITHGRIILSLAPKGLQKILHKALQPKIEDRYSDMVDFISDLSAYIKSGKLQQDKQGSDYFFELYETLEQVQSSLSPMTLPALAEVEIGLSALQSMGLSGQYYECVDRGAETIAFFISESKTKGATGVLQSHSLCTLFHTLLDVHKDKTSFEILPELIARIQTELHVDNPSFTYLELNTKKNEVHYFVQGGYGCLYTSAGGIVTDVLPLHNTVVDTVVDTIVLPPGNRLLFIGTLAEKEKIEPPIKEAIIQTKNLSCQLQAETILQRIRLSDLVDFEEQPLLLLNIEFLTGKGQFS